MLLSSLCKILRRRWRDSCVREWKILMVSHIPTRSSLSIILTHYHDIHRASAQAQCCRALVCKCQRPLERSAKSGSVIAHSSQTLAPLHGASPKTLPWNPCLNVDPKGGFAPFPRLIQRACCLFKPSKATIAAANRDSVEDASGTIVPRISPVLNWLVWKLI